MFFNCFLPSKREKKRIQTYIIHTNTVTHLMPRMQRQKKGESTRMEEKPFFN